jgi:hypothetical protein
LADGDDEIRTSGVLGFPARLQRHAGTSKSTFEGHGIGKHAFYIGDVRRAPVTRQSETIQVKADDRVVIPFAPPPERLIEEISPHRRHRSDHLHMDTQCSHTGG